MRTLHFGLRLADLERSLTFYTAVGYELVGSVPETPLGHLAMLTLPGDEFVTIELVHDPNRGEVVVAPGLSHFVIKVDPWTPPSVSSRRRASRPTRPHHQMTQTTF